MFGFGTQEGLIIAGILGGILLISALNSLRKSTNIQLYGRALVLRKFHINPNPKTDSDAIIDIEGRRSGLIAWLLTTLGLDVVDTITVSGREFRHKKASLMGQLHEVCSLTSISSVHCAYRRPIGLLILAVIVALFGLFAWMEGEGRFGYFLGSLIVGFIFFFFTFS